ncbi:MAG: hypothetical protein KAS11_02395 [Candidatus Aenigmarchaeota archaeon]|nr:hypothetical protein [Candidatus Aenigmarchaeota archaeon]
MDKDMRKWALAICSVFLVAGTLGSLVTAEDDEVDEINIWIDPSTISLNSNVESNAENDVMVTLGRNLRGMKITEENIQFIIGEDNVIGATSARVTRTGLVQVYFDKTAIQEYAIANNLKGDVAVTVSGSCTYEPIRGGSSGTMEFTGDSFVFFR